MDIDELFTILTMGQLEVVIERLVDYDNSDHQNTVADQDRLNVAIQTAKQVLKDKRGE